MSKEQSSTKPDKTHIQQAKLETNAPQQAEHMDIGPIQAAMADPATASRKSVRGAQRAFGNQHVQRTARRQHLQRSMRVNEPDDQYEKEAEQVADSLQRSAAPAGSAPTAPNNNDGSAEPAQAATFAPPVQRAMTVSSPDDPYEKEAEQVADSLQRSPDHVPPVGEDSDGGSAGEGGSGSGTEAARSTAKNRSDNGSVGSAGGGGVHRPVPTQLHGALFQRQAGGPEGVVEEELSLKEESATHLPPVGEGDDSVQRSGDGMDQNGVVNDGVSSQINRKRGSGQPLAGPVQRRMENHMGSDFSNVRVHNDSESDTLNRSLQAEAFTTGTDIFFSRDSYQPGSESGQKLIAHELTHVVQQGGAPSTAQRQDEEESVQLSPANGSPAIQRAGEDEGKEKTKEKAAEGRQEASGKKNEQEGKKQDAEGGANGEAKAIAAPIKPKIAAPPAAKDIPGVEENQMLSSTEREMPESMAGDELGVLGWPMTKEMAMPDWDGEVAKYDAFKTGDFEAMGADLSELEGYAIGLGDPITVDDPEVRAQMVSDALNGGLEGDNVGPLNYTKGLLLDSIPFAGTVASLGTLFTKGPGEWFGEMTGGVSNAAKNIGNAWSGLGEGSAWNRAASALELMIGILELVNSIVQFISAIALIVTIIGAIFLAIGFGLLSFIFTIGAGLSLISFWASPTIIAGKILLLCAAYLVQSQLLIRTMREIAIAFRIIDMLYYESDPEKLMERQAKLAEHTSGLNNAAFDNLKVGIRDDEEKTTDEDKVGKPPWEEGMEDPQVVDPGVERVSRMDGDEKQDYRANWLDKYGIDSTADQVREELSNSETEAPPLLEYQGDPIEDVVGRIDRNAVAIYELERQELTLLDEANETGQASEVAQQQVETLGAARSSVAENQRLAGEHQKDIDVKLKKQDDLKGKSQETEKTGEKSQGQSTKASGLSAVILALLKPIMPAMAASGENVGGEKQSQATDGGVHSEKVSDTSVNSAQESQKEAGVRTEHTKKAQSEANDSQKKLDETDTFLETNQEEAEEGVAGLQDLQSEMLARREEVAAAKEQLTVDRTEAIGDAMDWMISWREQRETLFEQMEGRLEGILPDQPKEGEGGDEEKSDSDFYDEETDQGSLKGYYGTSDIEGEYDPDDEERDADELEEFALDY